MSHTIVPRQPVAIDPVTAMAARLLRDTLAGTDGADLCAGADFDLDQLERLLQIVRTLESRLSAARAMALTSATPDQRRQYAYTFDVVDADNRVTSAITIRARGAHRAESLRVMAANLLIENEELYGAGVRLSSEPPRVTPSPE